MGRSPRPVASRSGRRTGRSVRSPRDPTHHALGFGTLRAEAPIDDPWRQIAHAWRRLAEIPPAAFDRLRDGLADEAVRLVDADWAALMVATIDVEPDGDPLFGWRLQLVDSPHVAAHLRAEMIEAMRRGLYVNDRRSRLHASNAGRTRVSLRTDGEPDATDDQMRQRLDAWGVADQLVAALPLADDVELYFAVSRLVGRPAFTTADRDRLRDALDGFRASAVHFVRSYGLFGPVALAPRERQAVALLLRGLSEKELADRLGIRPATAHEYVVSAYRKLGVRSRPELLHLWLAPQLPPASQA